MQYDPLSLIVNHLREQRAQIDKSLEDTDRTLRSTSELLEKIERLRARAEASRATFIAEPIGEPADVIAPEPKIT